MINRVVLRINSCLSHEGVTKKYASVDVHMFDNWFGSHIASSRDIRLAEKMAAEFDVELENQLPEEFIRSLK